MPKADINFDGLNAFLAQGENHQVVFMEFEKDVDIPKHSHESQWEIVLEGKVDLNINGKKQTYAKGDKFYIPKGVIHSGKVYSGYASIAFFNEKERYKKK